MILNSLLDLFRKKKVVKEVEVPKPELSAKELATANNEPWVNILSMELDPTDIGNGAIELDWNDIFIARLMKAGYRGKTDADIVDQWFSQICRNILQENYEQSMSDPLTREAVELTHKAYR